jgi:NAD(P)-dependent dehydrogenase (short-subunit alcohol dehydrogenase family)
MTDANVRRIAEKTGRGEDDIRARLTADQPDARLITPEEVAHAVMTFLPDQGGGFQGTSLILDGGGLRR